MSRAVEALREFMRAPLSAPGYVAAYAYSATETCPEHVCTICGKRITSGQTRVQVGLLDGPQMHLACTAEDEPRLVAVIESVLAERERRVW